MIIVSGGGDAPIASALEEGIRSRVPLARRELEAAGVGDPIRKGRLLSEVLAADLVIPVGDAATDFIAKEVEGKQIFFLGAARPSGTVLTHPHVGGLLAYSDDDVLSVVAAWRPGAVLAVVYTPGYEGLVRTIGPKARRRGLRLVEAPVAGRKALPAALQGLPESAAALWILGDATLIEDVAFEYSVEFALSRHLALIAPSPGEVARGALFAVASDPERLARAGAAAIDRILARGALPDPRVSFGPEGGRLFVHPVLRRRFDLKMEELPSGTAP